MDEVKIVDVRGEFKIVKLTVGVDDLGYDCMDEDDLSVHGGFYRQLRNSVNIKLLNNGESDDLMLSIKEIARLLGHKVGYSARMFNTIRELTEAVYVKDLERIIEEFSRYQVDLVNEVLQNNLLLREIILNKECLQ